MEQEAAAAATTALIVLFLDIDGVLLPFQNKGTQTPGCIFPDGAMSAFSGILQGVQRLIGEEHEQRNTAPRNFEMAVVLSSTWRVKRSYRQQILESFHAFGYAFGSDALLRQKDFYDITDPEMHSERQHEIHHWLQQQEGGRVVAWVALDDEDLLRGPANIKLRSRFEGKVVKPESHEGLAERHVEQTIRLLRNQLDLT